MAAINSRLTRIGMFYDGNFFSHVSNYYHYHHERRLRTSVSGIRKFVQHEVAKCEGTDARVCQIVDTHYFRGRLRASEAESRDMLYRERVFDDVLVREGVTTHYLPLGPNGEKGIDVWLALEALELTIHKRFDVVVLVVCDGDFLPLVRKLNTIGARVMVLGWDFKFVDQNGNERETRTAQTLLDEVSYPVMMHQIIDDRARRNDGLVNGLFVPRKETFIEMPSQESARAESTVNLAPNSSQTRLAIDANGVSFGTVKRIKDGFGFLIPDGGGADMFFYHSDVEGVDFLDLKVGDRVTYTAGRNEKGPTAKSVRPF